MPPSPAGVTFVGLMENTSAVPHDPIGRSPRIDPSAWALSKTRGMPASAAIASKSSTSAGWPYKWVAEIAAAPSSRSRTLFGSSVARESSTSANRGRPPAQATACALAEKVWLGITTSPRTRNAW